MDHRRCGLIDANTGRDAKAVWRVESNALAGCGLGGDLRRSESDATLCQSWQASGSARPNFTSKCSSNPSCFGPVSRSHLQGANVGDGTALGASRKLTSTGRDTPRCVSEYPHTKTSMHILALDLYRRILDTMDTAVLRYHSMCILAKRRYPPLYPWIRM